MKVITIVSTSNVTKIRAAALEYYFNFLKRILIFVAKFILSEVVALHKLGKKIILYLNISGCIT